MITGASSPHTPAEDAGNVPTGNPKNNIQPAPAFPTAHVLGYISGGGATTPTRVRTIASNVILVMGIVYLATAIVLAIWIALRVAEDVMLWGVPVTGTIILEVLQMEFNWRPGPIPFLLLGLGFVIGPPLLILARPIYRGGRVASILAIIGVVPQVALAALTTGICGAGALVWGIDFNGKAEPEKLWWLLVVPPGVFAVLLLKDLCGYLLWISRNPVTDKPPVPFVGRRP